MSEPTGTFHCRYCGGKHRTAKRYNCPTCAGDGEWRADTPELTFYPYITTGSAQMTSQFTLANDVYGMPVVYLGGVR